MNYSLYEEILSRKMIINGVIFGFGFCMLILIFFLETKNMWMKKRTYSKWETKQRLRLGDYLCIGMALFSLFLGAKFIGEYSYDLQNKAYIVWEGDFTIIQSGKSCFLYLPDESGIRLDLDESRFGGTYTGRVVYGEKSRLVLEYHIDEEKE